MSITLKDVESYWGTYTVGLDVLAESDGCFSALQQIKQNHDQAYAYANAFLDLPRLEGKSVLELACGLGFDTIEFVKHGARVTAIDVSRPCIDIARKHLSLLALDPHFLVGDVERLSFENETFDVVVARGILMYTPDPEKLIDEILRVLKPNGKASFLLHNMYSWYVLLAKLTAQNLYNQAKDPPINRLYSIRKAEKLLEGFSSAEIFLDRLPAKAVNRSGFLPKIFNSVLIPITKVFPDSLMRNFGYYLIINAVK